MCSGQITISIIALITLILWPLSVGPGRSLDWIKIVLNLLQFFFGDFFHCVGAKPLHTNILASIVNYAEFLEWNLVKIKSF